MNLNMNISPKYYRNADESRRINQVAAFRKRPCDESRSHKNDKNQQH
jgi:hypothetical protein